LAAALVGSMLVKIELRVSGEFRVLPTRNAEVRTEVEGLVAEVYVREGMKVQQGELVARLSDRDIVAELRKTEAEIAEKQATLRMLRIGTRPEEIEAMEAEVARRETQRRFLEEQLRLTKIASAIAGIVTTPERQLRDLIGQHVNRGDLLASVHRLDTVTAEIALSEKDVGDVAAGQRVAVKARAYPSLTFEGMVTSVAAAVRTNVATPLV